MGEEKARINILVMGHVNSGKSTTTGQLIHKLGGTNNGVMERFEKEAAETKKSWVSVLDMLKADHERGITALWKFETNKYDFSVIDTPRRTSILGNLLADCAVLVIDSTTAGFEQGISRDVGRTREDPSGFYMFGKDEIVCCCNKMDATTPKYSKGRYEEMVKQVSSIFEDIGYDPDKIPFIPISAIEGDNLTERSTNLDWYKGPTLLEALDNINQPDRSLDRPLFRCPFHKRLAADEAADYIINGAK